MRTSTEKLPNALVTYPIILFFLMAAPARFPMKSKTVQVTAGEAAHLQCAASGDSPLEVSWRSPHHHTIAHHLDQR
ncbi:hypothetical protein HF086_001865 [Spodoptera exigua]|uniref:Ig-like domain-containing protein n=1 Tax=Spodoptera exigua TaxID=7107 RepID=A0A922M914_SPOEX|nr:hypothetical protein HF086_001865 [Spodoptera exigua]